jgi:hypothetical protein
MDQSHYSAVMSIRRFVKGIPYGANGEVRPDGNANYGFKNLKGNLSLLAEVPELKEDVALYNVVSAINQPCTGLLSVGCVSGAVAETRGHAWTGYVEFAIDSVEAIADARSYFYIFYHFDKLLHDTKFSERANYIWELEGANFHPTNAGGFTCVVYVHTAHYPTPEQAKEAWERALAPLIPLFAGYPPQDGSPLFPPHGERDILDASED